MCQTYQMAPVKNVPERTLHRRIPIAPVSLVLLFATSSNFPLEQLSPTTEQKSDVKKSKRAFAERRARLKGGQHAHSSHINVTSAPLPSQPTFTRPPIVSQVGCVASVAKPDGAPPALDALMSVDPVIPIGPTLPNSQSSAIEKRRGVLDRLKRLRSELNPVSPPASAGFSAVISIPANATDVPTPDTSKPPLPTATKTSPPSVNPRAGDVLELTDASDDECRPSVSRRAGDVLELTDSSDDDEYPLPHPVSKELKAVYAKQREELLHPEPEVLPRQLHSSWKGTNAPREWICRPQDRHILQVVRDRQIADTFNDQFPQYVSGPAIFLSYSSCSVGYLPR